MALSDYERAMLRLEAWKAIQGWGTTQEPSPEADAMTKLTMYKPWGWSERMAKAAELFEWMAKTAEAVEQTFAPGWRHKNRGTEYTQVGIGELQSSAGPVEEGTRLVIYKGKDGDLWARPFAEFHDGRFKRIKE